MSWLWGNETTEQAQIVVSALQSELDEREVKIQALEAALRREQQDFQQLLQGEIRELEAKKSKIQQELQDVDALIKDKQKLLQKGKTGGGAKKKKAAAAATTQSNGSAAVAAAVEKQPSEKKKKKTKSAGDKAVNTSAAAAKKALPVDEHLQKVAKVEPNVAFIIQRSTNSNTVVYAGQVNKGNKKLDPVKPLEVYWIMYEKDGAPREDLNMIERNTAYGASCSPHATLKEHYAVVLSSLKDRECVLSLDEQGRVQAKTVIAGKRDVVLRRVFVQMTTGWVPTVDYVELFGVDPVTMELVYEKKSNNLQRATHHDERRSAERRAQDAAQHVLRNVVGHVLGRYVDAHGQRAAHAHGRGDVDRLGLHVMVRGRGGRGHDREQRCADDVLLRHVARGREVRRDEDPAAESAQSRDEACAGAGEQVLCVRGRKAREVVLDALNVRHGLVFAEWLAVELEVERVRVRVPLWEVRAVLEEDERRARKHRGTDNQRQALTAQTLRGLHAVAGADDRRDCGHERQRVVARAGLEVVPRADRRAERDRADRCAVHSLLRERRELGQRLYKSIHISRCGVEIDESATDARERRDDARDAARSDADLERDRGALGDALFRGRAENASSWHSCCRCSDCDAAAAGGGGGRDGRDRRSGVCGAARALGGGAERRAEQHLSYLAGGMRRAGGRGRERENWRLK